MKKLYIKPEIGKGFLLAEDELLVTISKIKVGDDVPDNGSEVWGDARESGFWEGTE